MSVNILQFGTTGQLATELLRQAGRHDVAVTALSRADCDLADPAAAARVVAAAKPDLVVIAAAYTAVDLAETSAPGPPSTPRRRGRSRRRQAAGAALVNVPPTMCSTAAAALTPEGAATNPLNVYARPSYSRRAGGGGVRPVARISALPVVSAHGKNFIKTMLRLAAA